MGRSIKMLTIKWKTLKQSAEAGHVLAQCIWNHFFARGRGKGSISFPSLHCIVQRETDQVL